MPYSQYTELATCCVIQNICCLKQRKGEKRVNETKRVYSLLSRNVLGATFTKPFSLILAKEWIRPLSNRDSHQLEHS